MPAVAGRISHGVLYLTHSADAHVKGVRSAPSPVQHLRGQFHSEASAFSLAAQSAGGGGVVRRWDPLVRDALVLDVIVSRTLLGPEIPRLCRAVLRRGDESVTTITLYKLISFFHVTTDRNSYFAS